MFVFGIINLMGCINGENYPEKFAISICETAYQCIDNGDIESFTQYDNVEDCIVDFQTGIQDSADYEAWQEGDATFNKENAQICLDEINEVQVDPECNGSMNVFSFFQDIQNDACGKIYE